MSDYIKREDVRDAILNEFDGDIRYTMSIDEFISDVLRVLNDIPAADVVEVVRCKDCKKRYTWECPCHYYRASDDWFCGSGKLQEETEEGPATVLDADEDW